MGRTVVLPALSSPRNRSLACLLASPSWARTSQTVRSISCPLFPHNTSEPPYTNRGSTCCSPSHKNGGDRRVVAVRKSARRRGRGVSLELKQRVVLMASKDLATFKDRRNRPPSSDVDSPKSCNSVRLCASARCRKFVVQRTTMSKHLNT